MVLTRSQAQAFYDRFGKKQDTQAFYEDAAVDDLVAHGEFEAAQSVFEFGCGTGRLAASLLENNLPCSASYLGTELSGTMAGLARQRLSAFADRAKVVQTDGAIHYPLPDHSVDCVVSAYVLDLLPTSDIHLALAEASRVLKPGGRLCLVSLTNGVTIPSRIVAGLWKCLFSLRAQLVGGCRPLQLDRLFDRESWSIRYRNVVTGYGVPSEVLVAVLK